MTTHTCTRHQPGERACYNGCACRCAPCRTANTRYVKRRNVALATGRNYRVPAAPVRAHVAELRASMSTQAIVDATGLSRTAIEKLTPDRATVARDTALRLLALQPATTRDNGKVDACGVRRRLQALHALGWSFTALGRHLDASPQLVRRWAHAQHVTTETRARIVAVYDHLWNTEPPQGKGATRSRSHAIRHGWPPPVAWDEDGPNGIDRPDAVPQGVQTGPRTRHGHTADLLADAIHGGASLGDLEPRFGMTWTAIEKALHRAGYYAEASRVRPLGLDGGTNQHTRKDAA